MVSVVIPSYNRAKTIERAVKSVLNQTYKDTEVIVVDDCSTDNTADIVKKLIKADKRVRYCKLEKNSGACAARNKGIELSQGEYIAFQDSDDEWLPKKLEIQLKCMAENRADICFCQFTRITDRSETIVPDMAYGFISRDVLLGESIVSTQTLIGKKHCFDGIAFDTAMPRMQDYDIVVRLSKKSDFYLVGEPLVNLYVQEDSLSKDWEKMKKAVQILREKYQDDIKHNKKMNCFLVKCIALSNERLKISSVKDRLHCFLLIPSFDNAKKIVKAILLRLGLYPSK